MKVLITHVARQDLFDIAEWIARDSPAAAIRWTDGVLARCAALSQSPLRYPRLPFGDLRKRPHGDYVIFYRVHEAVEIIRVLHAARDWTHLLNPDAEER